ncbi:MAG: DegT/DnrJ/EryC1/StrS family aminotransferase [Mariniblastus sp.]
MIQKTNVEMEIPFFKAQIGQEEIDSVIETLKSGWLTSGPKAKQFEQEFAEMVGAKFAIAVNSATAGLHLALEALGVGPGDEVLVPTLTFAATAEVVIHLGATPVLVDCREGDFNIDVDDMIAKITSKTKAVMPVHYAGHPCEMDEIEAVAKQHGLGIVEDAAHAFPAKYRGRTIGSSSNVSCFSFYANKTITTGEGGMITTDDEAVANRMRIMSLHGLDRGAWNRFSKNGKWFYEILEAGFKYNLSDVAAAIGIGQLHQAEKFCVERKRIALAYTEAFDGSPFVTTLEVQPHVDHSWHLFVIKINQQNLTIDRGQFIEQLNASGVSTSVHYTPLHLHPLYRDRYGYTLESMPTASRIYEQIISVPLFPGMTDEQMNYVISNVNRIGEANQK